MNASVAIQTLPEVYDNDETVRIVDEVIAYIKSTGYKYYVGPFETTVEGDYDELMDIVKECQHIAIRAGAPAVMAYSKVSFRPNGDLLTIDRKVTKHHLDEKENRQYISGCLRHYIFSGLADTLYIKGNTGIFDAVTDTDSKGVERRFFVAYVSPCHHFGRKLDWTGCRRISGIYICSFNGQIYKCV